MESSNPPPRRSRWFRIPGNKKLWLVGVSYTGDWLLTFLLIGSFFALERLEGFRRRFSLTDETIQYPYTVNERVPNLLLVILVYVVPLCTMPLINLVSIRSFWDFHNSELGLTLAVALTGAVTTILKLTAGRPRPDLIARCLPRSGSQNAAVFGLVDQSICTQTDFNILNDGWKSFASGHSSLSFAGLGFMSLYIAGKMHLFDQRGHTIKAWISVFPLFGATIIAITRTMDYRHHWQDVSVGLVLGFTIAYFSYRQYYPSLEHPLSHLPFAPRKYASGNYANSTELAGYHPSKDSGSSEISQRRDLETGSGIRVQEEEFEDFGSEDGLIPRSDATELRRIWTQKGRRTRSISRGGEPTHEGNSEAVGQ